VITPSSWTCSILSTWSLLVWYVSAEGPTSTYIMYHPLHGCTYSCVEESEHSQYSQNATHVADRKSTRLLWRCTFCLDWTHTAINCRVSWQTNMASKTVLAATRDCKISSGFNFCLQLLPLSKPQGGFGPATLRRGIDWHFLLIFRPSFDWFCVEGVLKSNR
jgi:hypothetical protein